MLQKKRPSINRDGDLNEVGWIRDWVLSLFTLGENRNEKFIEKNYCYYYYCLISNAMSALKVIMIKKKKNYFVTIVNTKCNIGKFET